MVERSEGKESLHVFLVPRVSVSDIEVPHTLAHLDVLLTIISVVTESAGAKTNLSEPPERLSGEDVSSPAREIPVKHFEMMPEVNGIAGTVVL